ncbi:MAG: PorP/SprF family type IX secretion system membrane protein [Bacteroidetes bacterium]|nr:PorP/SprF family type IX secretion system membrane protein [Bacteroidota bacterium]
MFSINIKTITTAAAGMLLFGTAGAQQVFKISQYQENNFIHNPAAVGANGFTTVGGVFRSQWSGIEGSPRTVAFLGDTYIEKSKLGLGAQVFSDKTGPTSRNSAEIDASYSVPVDDKGTKLMMGLGLQAIQFKVDKNAIAEYIPNDPLLASSASATKGDIAAGLYLHSEKFNVGISAKQILQPKLDFVKSSTNVDGKLYRHFFLVANYNIRTDEANVLVPHFELRYQPNAPVDYEGGVMLVHKDLITVGVSAHYKQDYTVFAGIKLDHKFSISYAYDVYNNPINTFDGGNGGHELMLRYFFKK